jgi:ribulose-phosphate 3-epimerase
MIQVVPTIIPENYADILGKVSRVKGIVPRVQIDVADGTYAPSKTWPYNGDESHLKEILAQTEGLPYWDEMDYEVDLLINEPERAIDTWIQVGIAAAIVHVESTQKLDEIIKKLKDVDCEIGLGIKPSTPNEELYRYIGTVDFVQCMGSDEIGFAGVSLDERVYDKIKSLRAQFPELPIAVDIGVDDETAPLLVEAGATKLASGSLIFGSEDIRDTVTYLQGL